jgi:hypothetical protein
MSNNQPPRVQLNFEPDYEPPEDEMLVDEVVEDDDENEVVVSHKVVLPSVVERQKINSSDIFDMSELENELDDMPDNLAVLPDTLRSVIKEPKKLRKVNKNGKARKPMSEEHKQKLAEARKLAVEARKAKASERKQQQALDKEETELLKKQKVKRVQKLKQEVEEPEEPAPAVSEAKQRSAPVNRDSETWVTKKDLEQAQYEAIAKYETLRKQRKAEKRQAEMVERERQTLIRKLQPQTYKYRDGSNLWDSCY